MVDIEDPEPTHCCRRQFSHRPTGLPWNLTFAGAAENSRDGDSGRSPKPAEGLGSFGVGRLHPMGTNWCSRPIAVSGSAVPSDGKVPIAAVPGEHAVGSQDRLQPVGRRRTDGCFRLILLKNST